MKRIKFIITLTILCSAAFSQTPSMDGFKKWDSTHAKLDPAEIENARKLALSGADSTAPEVAAKMMEYFHFTVDHRIHVLRWQFYSTIGIYFMVITIVLTGLWLSYRQFKMAEPASRTIPTGTKLAETELVVKDQSILKTELEIGKDSIKINTAVIGLVILVVSIAFFFLYLQYAYSVSIIK
ncbi:MAG: hypothetical protein ABI581_14885 [Sediminibacterium sp.]